MTLGLVSDHDEIYNRPRRARVNKLYRHSAKLVLYCKGIFSLIYCPTVTKKVVSSC